MTIHFYLNDTEETPITSFYDLESNPFSLNDIVKLRVEELYPVDYNKYNNEIRKKLIDDNAKLEKIFRHKKIKLVEENKYMSFKILGTPKLTIEYYCELVD